MQYSAIYNLFGQEKREEIKMIRGGSGFYLQSHSPEGDFTLHQRRTEKIDISCFSQVDI